MHCIKKVQMGGRMKKNAHKRAIRSFPRKYGCLLSELKVKYGLHASVLKSQWQKVY